VEKPQSIAPINLFQRRPREPHRKLASASSLFWLARLLLTCTHEHLASELVSKLQTANCNLLRLVARLSQHSASDFLCELFDHKRDSLGLRSRLLLAGDTLASWTQRASNKLETSQDVRPFCRKTQCLPPKRSRRKWPPNWLGVELGGTQCSVFRARLNSISRGACS